MSSTLFVHLDKLGHNLKVIESYLGKDVKRMAVIKDEAYGHGLIPVANYLENKVDWFCVAELEEAIRLRKAGIEKPILVFEIPPIGEEQAYKEYNITATIADISVFKRLLPGTKCHFNFDTGMGRLGMLPSEADEVLRKMDEFPDLNYTGVYTHFANADGNDEPTVDQQINRFLQIREKLPKDLMTHTCNSAGILYHSQKNYFDAVRIGVALYGYAPGDKTNTGLEAIIEWKSHLVQVKKICKGDTVGYGSRWRAPEDGWLGIVPIGYSDGVFRGLSGKIEVEIGENIFPQVGTISMDYMAVYLGENKFQEGTEVTILKNGNLSANKWAMLAGTIPYEITTVIAPKVKRVYLGDQ